MSPVLNTDSGTEWRSNKEDYEKIMHKGAYTKKITNCLKALDISSQKKRNILVEILLQQ